VHHGIRIKDAAILAAATVAPLYHGPVSADKAIDLIDEAAASLRMQVDSLPVEIDEIERRVLQLEIERQALLRESDSIPRKGYNWKRTSRPARGIQRTQGALAGGKPPSRNHGLRSRSSSSRRKRRFGARRRARARGRNSLREDGRHGKASSAAQQELAEIQKRRHAERRG
jgi:ATP-dependent Clp protease ATP-binding subunit ClpB